MSHIKLIDSTSEFASLEKAWRQLSEQSTSCSVFNSWDWQWLWWKTYSQEKSRERKLQILVLYDHTGPENNHKQEADPHNICAILPLYSQTIQFLKVGHAKELRLIGTGGDTSPDYLGPLLSDNISASHLQLLCNAVATMTGWDTLHLSDLQEQTAFIDCLDKALASSTLSRTKSTCSVIHYINLGNDFNDYLAQLSSNQRKQIKRRRRRFEESGDTRFFVWPNTKDLEPAFEQLTKLHLQRWSEKTGAGSFTSDSYLSFHRAVMEALQERDNLRLYCLEHNGVIMAVEYSYQWNNAIYSFQCGFNPEYQEYRPGQLLLNYSIENAIEENVRQYDLLKGDYDYKRSAAKEQRNTLRYNARQRNVIGLLLNSIDHAKAFIKPDKS